ncbi:MAG TPA: 3-keto-5-aminohexanoate cleavage protein [Magnetospirillaceae bacterium]
MNLKKRKVIISCAVTGAAHTPSMSDHLPLTPEEITQQAVDAARAGASILHLHARDPEDGSPSLDPAVFDRFVPQIAAQTDAIINITTEGYTHTPLDERLAYPLQAKPELCSLNMGSINLSLHRAWRGITDWKFPWEQSYVEESEGVVIGNTLSDIKDVFAYLGDTHDVRFEFECYDLGHLHNLALFVEEGLVRGPLFIQCAVGVSGGLNADPENLFVMRSTADRLFGRDNYEFSVLGAGRNQMSLVTMGAIMGGHVRVGLEDSLFLGRSQLAPSCAAQVLKIRRLLEELSLEIATPAEAREILQTKGAHKVAFHG